VLIADRLTQCLSYALGGQRLHDWIRELKRDVSLTNHNA
jgi:hypothetical protein